MPRKLRIIGNFLTGDVDPAEIKAIVDEYLSENPPAIDGVSPTVSIEKIDGGHRVTITDVNGPHSFDVSDGITGGSHEVVEF